MWKKSCQFEGKILLAHQILRIRSPGLALSIHWHYSVAYTQPVYFPKPITKCKVHVKWNTQAALKITFFGSVSSRRLVWCYCIAGGPRCFQITTQTSEDLQIGCVFKKIKSLLFKCLCKKDDFLVVSGLDLGLGLVILQQALSDKTALGAVSIHLSLIV